mmetsp:Transcript_31976/g.58189  ORF Transcript_31976/g.58189 Transcript_31976/m.58189 type:complete len:277 (-) Transcript_31976:1988-2818(-)
MSITPQFLRRQISQAVQRRHRAHGGGGALDPELGFGILGYETRPRHRLRPFREVAIRGLEKRRMDVPEEERAGEGVFVNGAGGAEESGWRGGWRGAERAEGRERGDGTQSGLKTLDREGRQMEERRERSTKLPNDQQIRHHIRIHAPRSRRRRWRASSRIRLRIAGGSSGRRKAQTPSAASITLGQRIPSASPILILAIAKGVAVVREWVFTALSLSTSAAIHPTPIQPHFPAPEVTGVALTATCTAAAVQYGVVAQFVLQGLTGRRFVFLGIRLL